MNKSQVSVPSCFWDTVCVNDNYKPQSREAHNRLWLVASVCSYGGLQGARNRDYCAVVTVATQGVSKRNPCWPGWRPAGGRGQYLRLSQGARK